MTSVEDDEAAGRAVEDAGAGARDEHGLGQAEAGDAVLVPGQLDAQHLARLERRRVAGGELRPLVGLEADAVADVGALVAWRAGGARGPRGPAGDGARP